VCVWDPNEMKKTRDGEESKRSVWWKCTNSGSGFNRKGEREDSCGRLDYAQETRDGWANLVLMMMRNILV